MNGIQLVCRSMRALLMIASIGFLMACVHLGPYRVAEKPCQLDDEACNASANELYRSAGNGSVSIVELDDQGRPAKSEQIAWAEKALSRYDKADHLAVLVFVHGWHHDARQNDKNLREFVKAVDQLQTTASTLKQTVHGIYIGWRGESISVPGVNVLTFWDRKNSAHEVGETATDIFLRLDSAARAVDATRVYIGHSFGGAVVYSALNQLMIERSMRMQGLAEAERSADARRSVAELVVLVNPAFEAMKTVPLVPLTSGFAACRPWLVSFTAENDWATGTTFPAGRFFNTLFESYADITVDANDPTLRNLSERRLDYTALGHMTELQTHDLSQHAVGAESKGMAAYKTGCDSNASIALGSTVLTPRKPNANRLSFWNVYVEDDQIIDGHNGIWKPIFVEALSELVMQHVTR